MKKDILFLLKADFEDPSQPGIRFVCPDCAIIEGLLGYYPQLRNQLEIHYIDFRRPRPDVIRYIGEANQSCPVLILAEKPEEVIIEDLFIESSGDHFFINIVENIAEYLFQKYNIGKIH